MSEPRGYFAIGIQHTKTEVNVGTLFRTADILGAAFVFTVGRRYVQQASDTLKSWRHMPLFHFQTLADLHGHLPYGCQIVGIELTEDATPLAEFAHPERAVYLLGAEDHGLPQPVLRELHHVIKIPGDRSLNVAVAGSIVLYDRVVRA